MARMNDTAAVRNRMPGGGRRAGLGVSGSPILDSRYSNDSYTPSFVSGPYDQAGRVLSSMGPKGKVGGEELDGALEENCKPLSAVRKP